MVVLYLMLADEADQDGSKEFLVMASIFFPSEALKPLHKAVEAERRKAGFAPTAELKFKSRSRPATVNVETHTVLKNRVLELAAEHGCQACCYLAPHSIAGKQPLDTRLKWGANTLLLKFDQFLRIRGEAPGLVLFDRTSDYNQHDYFKSVFQESGERKLKNIVGLGVTSSGASHLASVCDIVVGACRFAINEPMNESAGRVLMKAVAKILWHERSTDGAPTYRDYGLCIRPKDVAVVSYRADIEALISRLNKYVLPQG